MQYVATIKYSEITKGGRMSTRPWLMTLYGYSKDGTFHTHRAKRYASMEAAARAAKPADLETM